jgi:predicted ATPase
MPDKSITSLVSHIEIENFKAVENASIELSQLTAVVGVNSSGKSTFIQAILLMVQHIKDDYSTDLKYSLNEELVQLGSFRDTALRTESKTSDAFRIKLTTNANFSDRFRIDDSASRDRSMVCIKWNAKLTQDESADSRFARLKELQIQEDGPAMFAGGDDENHFDLLIESISEPGSVEYDEISRIPIDGDRSLLRIVNGRLNTDGATSLIRFALFEPGRLPAQYQISTVSTWLSQFASRYVRMSERVSLRMSESEAEAFGKRGSSKDSAEKVESRPQKLLDPKKILGDFSSKLEPSLREICEKTEYWADFSRIDKSGAQVKANERMDEQCTNLITQLRKAILRSVNDFEDAFHKSGVTSEMVASEVRITVQKALRSDFSFIALQFADDESSFMPSASRTRQMLRNSLTRVYYLGPIRDIDRGISGSFVRRSLGLHGELCATVLQRETREKIRNAPLPRGVVDVDESSRFGEVLNAWMKFLDLADAVEVEDRGRYKAGIRIVPRRGGLQTVSVNSVGVGVAQVLPVVMQCLLADPYTSLTIIEQPELHLHPSIEVKLAEFFIACARTGRQIFIETHSEHLINRLRLEIARDESGETRELVSVLFANQDKDTGITSYENAVINEIGGIEGGWPEDFLDLSTDQSLSLLKVATRRRQNELFADSDDDDDF